MDLLLFISFLLSSIQYLAMSHKDELFIYHTKLNVIDPCLCISLYMTLYVIILRSQLSISKQVTSFQPHPYCLAKELARHKSSAMSPAVCVPA